MRTGSRLVWLGLTPEPERELPAAVATLRARSTGGAGVDPTPWIEVEVRRIEALILHGTQRGWLRYLAEVTTLVIAAADPPSVATNRPAATDRTGTTKPTVVTGSVGASGRQATSATTPAIGTTPTTDSTATPDRAAPTDRTATTDRAAATDRELALHAAETVLDHHRMLIGLPGYAYERVATQREALAVIVERLRDETGAR
jgi:hypothetical protein